MASKTKTKQEYEEWVDEDTQLAEDFSDKLNALFFRMLRNPSDKEMDNFQTVRDALIVAFLIDLMDRLKIQLKNSMNMGINVANEQLKRLKVDKIVKKTINDKKFKDMLDSVIKSNEVTLAYVLDGIKVNTDNIIKDIKSNVIETKKVISETLGQNQNTNPNLIEPNIIEKDDTGTELITDDKLAHTYMLAGFLGPDMSSKDIYVADVALNVLGAGKSSRLNRILKEEKQLVYSISSSFMTLNGTGTAYISAIFDKTNYEQVKDALIQELDKFTAEGPTQEELQKIKINMKSDWLFDLQTFNEQASLMGFWKLFNHLEVFEKYLKNIEKVTVDDVKNFMKKYYSKEKLSKVVVFPK